MLCLVHGYSLTGSGSNQWSRSIAEGLVRNGETVHLVCQEHRPEAFDFISASYVYDGSGACREVFQREIEYPGACIMHRPELDLLPTYVRPQASNTYMVAMLDLDEVEIQEYLRRNEVVMAHVLDRHDISAVQVNHVVLMSVAVQRACTPRRVPYAVLPHGSAIEYVVKHDEAMRRLAMEALDRAARILVLSDELKERIGIVFPELEQADHKMIPASAGVDTERFHIVDRSRRDVSIQAFLDELGTTDRGKSIHQRTELRAGLADDMSLEELLDLLERTEDYPPKLPDASLEGELEKVDWQADEVIVFVGKIIGYKGLPSLVAAFPLLAAERPRLRLILAGRGNLRGGLEAMVFALADGKRRLFENIVRWGGAIEGEEQSPFDRVAAYLDGLRSRGELETYYRLARDYVDDERIIFTGYVEHHLLRHLFPCCDVAIFPSIVKEAAPLVVPEAMASGCFPIGTDYAGMAASLNVASQAVPDDVGALMRLRHSTEHTVADIVRNVPAALEVAGGYRESLRQVAIDRYDWRSVAATLAGHMREMTFEQSR